MPNPKIMVLDEAGKPLTHFTQWDANREITITGLGDFEVQPELHYWDRDRYRAIVVPTTGQGPIGIKAKVPNILLQSDDDVVFTVFGRKPGDMGEAKSVFIHNVPVYAAVKPEDYEWTENIDYISFTELIKEAEALLELLKTAGETIVAISKNAEEAAKQAAEDALRARDAAENAEKAAEAAQNAAETVRTFMGDLLVNTDFNHPIMGDSGNVPMRWTADAETRITSAGLEFTQVGSIMQPFNEEISHVYGGAVLVHIVTPSGLLTAEMVIPSDESTATATVAPFTITLDKVSIDIHADTAPATISWMRLIPLDKPCPKNPDLNKLETYGYDGVSVYEFDTSKPDYEGLKAAYDAGRECRCIIRDFSQLPPGFKGGELIPHNVTVSYYAFARNDIKTFHITSPDPVFLFRFVTYINGEYQDALFRYASLTRPVGTPMEIVEGEGLVNGENKKFFVSAWYSSSSTSAPDRDEWIKWDVPFGGGTGDYMAAVLYGAIPSQITTRDITLPLVSYNELTNPDGLPYFTFEVMEGSEDLKGFQVKVNSDNTVEFVRTKPIIDGGKKQVFTAVITDEVGRLVCDMTAKEIIDASRQGVVKAEYTDDASGETREYYYFKQMPDGRAVFTKDGYIENGVPKQTLFYVDFAGNVEVETREPGAVTCYAVCDAEAAPAETVPVTWYIPKDMPKPTGNVGMMIDVFWKNGRASGIGYDVSLVWGEEGGSDNVVIVPTSPTTSGLTGEYSIPAEGTVRYQLIEQSGKKRWKYVSGKLLSKQFSTDTAADAADKLIHGMQIGYLPGMEIFVQLDQGNTSDTMRLVPDEGATLPVYGNGTGAKAGTYPAGYILHLKNAGDHWQVINSHINDYAPAIPVTMTGAAVSTGMVSPVEHEIQCKINGVPNPETVTVSRYGKNLAKVQDPSRKILTSFPVFLCEGVTYTVSLKDDTATAEVIGFVNEKDTNFFSGGTSYVRNRTSFTYKADKSGLARCYIEPKSGGSFANAKFQLEVGDVQTAYEPYVEVAKFNPNSDGNVSGITSVTPNMAILTDNPGATITATYNADTKKYVNTLSTAKQSTSASTTLMANELQKFPDPLTGTVTLNLAPHEGYAEYNCEFVVAASGCNLSLPASVQWDGGAAPSLKPDTRYQLSILNNIAVISKGVPSVIPANEVTV